jgi:hypothetical protein
VPNMISGAAQADVGVLVRVLSGDALKEQHRSALLATLARASADGLGRLCPALDSPPPRALDLPSRALHLTHRHLLHPSPLFFIISSLTRAPRSSPRARASLRRALTAEARRASMPCWPRRPAS